MCCTRINTEALLANLFAQTADQNYSLSDLQDYFTFLTEHFPLYVASDFSERAVRECVEKYPMLYQGREQDGDFIVCPGEQIPNLSFFNRALPNAVSEYLGGTTSSFLTCLAAPAR